MISERCTEALVEPTYLRNVYHRYLVEVENRSRIPFGVFSAALWLLMIFFARLDTYCRDTRSSQQVWTRNSLRNSGVDELQTFAFLRKSSSLHRRVLARLLIERCLRRP